MDNRNYRPSQIHKYIFIVLCIFYAYEFFLRIVPSILVDPLLLQYHTSAQGIAGFSSSYFLGYLLMQLPAGFLIDWYGFKKTIIAALLTCVLGTVIFTSSHQIWLGILGRFILGGGSAFAFLGALSFIRQHFPSRYFALLVAIVISVGTVAGAFGQVFAVQIIHYLSWHFTIDGMAIWGCLLALAIYIAPNHSLNFFSTKSNNAITFFWKDCKKLFTLPALWLNALIGGLLYLPTSIIVTTWGVEFFEKVFNLSPETSSIGITLLLLGWAVGGPIFGLLASRYSLEKPLLTISALTTALLLFILLQQSHLNAVMLWTFLFIFGVLSSAQVLVWRIFTTLSPNKGFTGLESSFTNLIIMLTVSIFDLILGKIINLLNSPLDQQLHTVSGMDLRVSFYLLPLLMLFSVSLIWALPSKKSSLGLLKSPMNFQDR